MRFNVIAVIDQVCKAVCEMYMFRWDRVRQSAMEIAAVKGIVGCTESRLDCFTQRGAEQNTTIIPAPLVKTGRLNSRPSEFVSYPKPMQDARRIGTNINASADFAQRSRLFVDLGVKSSAQQQSRCGEAAYAPANDCDRAPACDRHTG
jgi:hypothetical protein